MSDGPVTLGAALRGTHDEAWQVRVAATSALGAFPGEPARGRLVELCAHRGAAEDPDVIEAAGRVLWDGGPAGRDAFLRVWDITDQTCAEDMTTVLMERNMTGDDVAAEVAEREQHALDPLVRDAAAFFLRMHGW